LSFLAGKIRVAKHLTNRLSTAKLKRTPTASGATSPTSQKDCPMKKSVATVITPTNLLCHAEIGLSTTRLGLLLADYPKIFERVPPVIKRKKTDWHIKPKGLMRAPKRAG
jgi:hypothetical protein